MLSALEGRRSAAKLIYLTHLHSVTVLEYDTSGNTYTHNRWFPSSHITFGGFFGPHSGGRARTCVHLVNSQAASPTQRAPENFPRPNLNTSFRLFQLFGLAYWVGIRYHGSLTVLSFKVTTQRNSQTRNL